MLSFELGEIAVCNRRFRLVQGRWLAGESGRGLPHSTSWRDCLGRFRFAGRRIGGGGSDEASLEAGEGGEGRVEEF